MASNSKTVSGGLASLVVIGGAVGIVYLANRFMYEINFPKLQEVEHIYYDYETNLLSWNGIENATYYEVDINGTIEETQTNSFYYVPVKSSFKVRVKAYDATEEYRASDWSKRFYF